MMIAMKFHSKFHAFDMVPAKKTSKCRARSSPWTLPDVVQKPKGKKYMYTKYWYIKFKKSNSLDLKYFKGQELY